MGLTEEQNSTIKATIPLLEVGGELLINHFYRLLLTEYPEVAPFFNKSHQSSGDQPRALANAVLAYAKNIDRLQNLGPVASQIINKHVSLGVRPDQYPLVGTCLLRSIREVLGAEIVTDLVIDAWAAAYQQLADILIAAEEKVYHEHETAVGGWRGDRGFTLARKEREAEFIVSFYFTPEDNGRVLHYEAGQFTCVHVPDLNGEDIRRNYSLSQCHPGHEAEAVYRISVKRETHGVMSNYLHNLPVGARVLLLPPAGEFVYHPVEDNTRPLVLLAVGTGITTIYSILMAALKASPTRPITLIYCTKNPGQTAFRQELAALAQEHARLTLHHWFSQDRGRRMDKHDLLALLPKRDATTIADLDVYFVAPKEMMREVKHYFLDDWALPAENIYYEFYGPQGAI
jgi:nitric oxide dioxygenase